MPMRRIRTIILTKCPENRVTLPSPSTGDLIRFLTSAFAFTPLRVLQTSQKDTGYKKPPKFLNTLGVVLSLELAVHPSLCFFSWNKNSDIWSPIYAPLPTLSALCCLFSPISFSSFLCLSLSSDLIRNYKKRRLDNLNNLFQTGLSNNL